MGRSNWPTYVDMTFLMLHEGPGDGVRIDVAPTMKTITYQGERYFRMPDSRARDGVEYGGSYLWDRWVEEVLKPQLAAKKAAEALA